MSTTSTEIEMVTLPRVPVVAAAMLLADYPDDAAQALHRVMVDLLWPGIGPLRPLYQPDDATVIVVPRTLLESVVDLIDGLDMDPDEIEELRDRILVQLYPHDCDVDRTRVEVTDLPAPLHVVEG